MSATTLIQGPVRYKDQLKMARAETAASWLAIAVERLVGETKADPAVIATDEPDARPRWYGAYY